MAVKTPSQFITLANALYPTNNRGEITASVLRTGQLQTFIELGITAVTSFGVDIPPASPAATDAYIIGNAPSGIWIGKANKLAYRNAGAWVYYPATGAIGPDQSGLEVWALDTDTQYTWTGTNWDSGGGGGGAVDSVFGRTGVVVAAGGDYNASQITNNSAVAGVDVAAALNTLNMVFSSGAKGLTPASGGGSVNFLRADGTWAVPPGAGGIVDGNYGDITVSSTGTVWTINADAVTFAKMQNITTDRLIGRDTASTGNPEEISVGGGIEFTESAGLQVSAFTGDATKTAGGTTLTLATVNGNVGSFGDATHTVLVTVNAKGLITAISSVAITGLITDGDKGDITVSSSGATWTIDNNVVTNAKLAQVATATFKGRTTASTGNVEDLTVTQATALLNEFTSLLKGLVPASGGGTTTFLRADGTFAIPPGSGGISDGTYGQIVVSGGGTVWTIGANEVAFDQIVQIATDTLLGRDTASTGDVENITLNATLSMTGSGALQRAALTGDITASAGSNATTLATVNSNIGTFGSATAVSQVTVNAKGLTTAAADVNIAIPSTQVTDFTEAAQDATGAMVGVSLVYVDATPLLVRAALTGDITSAQNSNATTLATVNSNVGTFGDGTNVAQVTVNAKGLVTAVSNVAITVGVSDGDKGDITVSSSGTVWTIDNDVVTFAKMQNIATDSLIGRDTASTGDPENILLNTTLSMDGSGNLQRAALTGDVTASAGSNTTTLATVNAGVGTFGSATQVSQITVNAKGLITAVSNVTISGVAPPDGDKGDITVSSTGTVWTIDANVVTFAKMQQVATDSLLGRDTASTGNVENILLNATLSMDGSGNLQRAALTGDATASAGSNALTLATVNANVGSFGSATQTVTVTFNAKGLATAAAQQNIAIPHTQITDFDEAAQDAVGSILFDSSTIDLAYNDGVPTITAGVILGSITNAELANMATATFKGRASGGTGQAQDMSATTATALLDAFTSGAKGLAPASGGGTANFLRADGTWTTPGGGTQSTTRFFTAARNFALP